MDFLKFIWDLLTKWKTDRQSHKIAWKNLESLADKFSNLPDPADPFNHIDAEVRKIELLLKHYSNRFSGESDQNYLELCNQIQAIKSTYPDCAKANFAPIGLAIPKAKNTAIMIKEICIARRKSL